MYVYVHARPYSIFHLIQLYAHVYAVATCLHWMVSPCQNCPDLSSREYQSQGKMFTVYNCNFTWMTIGRLMYKSSLPDETLCMFGYLIASVTMCIYCTWNSVYTASTTCSFYCIGGVVSWELPALCFQAPPQIQSQISGRWGELTSQAMLGCKIVSLR